MRRLLLHVLGKGPVSSFELVGESPPRLVIAWVKATPAGSSWPCTDASLSCSTYCQFNATVVVAISLKHTHIYSYARLEWLDANKYPSTPIPFRGLRFALV